MISHECATCGEQDLLCRECQYCTEVHCLDHALPERHDCSGLSRFEGEAGWFHDYERR